VLHLSLSVHQCKIQKRLKFDNFYSRSIGETSRYFLENDHGKVAIYEAKMDDVDSVSLPDGCFWTILSAAKKNFIWTGDEHGVIFPTCEEILIIGIIC